MAGQEAAIDPRMGRAAADEAAAARPVVTRSFYPYAIVLFSAVFHALALAALLLRQGELELPRRSIIDLGVLVCVSLLMAFAPLVVKNGFISGILFFFRAFFYLLVSIPLGALIGPRALLLASLLMDIGAFYPPKASVPIVGFLALLITFVPGPQYAFGRLHEPSSLVDRLSVLLPALSTAFLSILLRKYAASLAAERMLNGRLRASVHRLTSANTDFLTYASVVEKVSALSERNRITRELHDVIGQTLTNIIVMMDASLRRTDIPPEETTRLHQWVRSQARDGLEESRAALYELRSMREDRLTGLRALKKLVDVFGDITGIKISVEWTNLPWELGNEIDQAVYRIVQEALTNSFRHGLAKRIEISFIVSEGSLHLCIRDDGKGGEDEKRGIGQAGMQERVTRLGGEISFRSGATGYVVTARIPFGREVTA